MTNTRRTAKRILLITFHAYPDRAVGAVRPSEFARTLAQRGYEIDIVSSTLPTDSNSTDSELTDLPGVSITRIPRSPRLTSWFWRNIKLLSRHKTGAAESRTAKSTGQKQGPGHESESLKDRIRRHYHALRLILDGQKIWGLLALSVLAIRRFRCRYDAVISSSPPSAAHVVALASSKLFSCRLALDFRDPWIGNANYDPASTNWFREKVERALEARCCAAAGLIVTTTPGSRRLLIDRYSELGNRVHVVYNGYDKLCDTPADASDRKSLRMVFAGSLYLKRDPFFLMEAVKRLVENVDVDRHKVNLLFVGDCEFWNGRSLSEWVVANDMADVISIRSRVPKDELTTIIDQCNLLVNLAQGQPNQIPAKTFDYMGSGKEMLVVTEVESDTARLVNETMSGRILDPSSEHSASSVLEELYFAAVNGETLVRRRPDTARSFSRQSQNSHFLNLFESEID